MLEFENTTKTFGKLRAVDNLNLKIEEGQIFGLLGPNGAGKTTLLKMLMGLLKPTSGKITLFDETRLKRPQVRRQVGYMPQHLAIYPGLTVRENILFFGRLYGVEKELLKQHTQEILALSEMDSKADELVQNLSGGMWRRTMLASALVHKPRLLVLDEPTAGVDPVLRIKFWHWFEKLVDEGTSILVTTHHIAEADRCDRVVFLRSGKIIADDTPNNLMERFFSENLEDAFVRATGEDTSNASGDHNHEEAML